MQTQNLQIIPKGIKPIIKASQFDVGREFQLKLYDGAVAYTPPTGTALRLDGVKPDGTVFSYTENLSLSGSTITVTTTTQMTILEGTVQCEIRMTKDNDDIGTINFDLMVEKSPINETTDLSQTEVPALVTLARTQMENAEAWAVGTKDGVPVTSDNPQYHNNAKYYSDNIQSQVDAAAASATSAASSATSASSAASNAASSATTAGNAADRAEAAVVKAPYIGNNGNWYVYDFSADAYVDTGVDATGETGNGIASVTKTGTSGLVDTYTITYTDGSTSTFTVTNGQDGAPGVAGNGIVSITKTGTSGLVDTYTITYTNGSTSTFTVTNGQNGTGAGDMLAADYDPTQAVFNAGGIVAYVASQISGISTSLSGLTDVALTSLAAGQSLIYDATAQKWVNGSVSSSDVNYVNTTSELTATNVQDAIDEVAAENQTLTNQVDTIVNDLGAKNLLLPNNAVSQTINGVTFTVNDDGSVTANGTATNDVYFNVANNVVIPKGNYKLNGCPSGGSVSTYNIYCEGTGVTVARDTGEGADYNFDSEKIIRCYITIVNGTTVDNITFYPMLRPASIKDSTYVSYTKTNRELTVENQSLNNEVSDIVNILGAKNLLPNKAVSQTIAGVTFTKNSNGSITINGTATTDIGFTVARIGDLGLSGNCILSGCTDGDKTTSYALMITNEVNSEEAQETSEITVNMATYSSPTYPTSAVYIFVKNGATVSNKTIYPMLRLATDADATYQPYALTNQQITPYVQAISNPNLLDNPWFTVNQRGENSKSDLGYFVDRWSIGYNPSNSVVSLSNGIFGIDATNGVVIVTQRFEHSNLSGKTVTLSILLSDGSIKQGTNVFPSLNGADASFISETGYSVYGVHSTQDSAGYEQLNILVNQGNTLSIKAVKLELGTVSTLAQDTAPNYATELLKCQRYFERNRWYDWCCVNCTNAGQLYLGMSYPYLVEKRVAPTFQFNVIGNTGIGNGHVMDLTDGTTIPASEVVLQQPSAWNIRMIQMKIAHSSFTVGHTYAVGVGDNTVDISADL